MSPKLITAALAATVICFAGVGVVTVKSVSKHIAANDKEFEMTSNVLSPLFDIYGLAIVDGQAKASKGLIDAKEFCSSLNLVAAYLKKARDVCDRGEISSLNSPAMTAELYAVIEPMTALINEALHEELTISRTHKDAADRALLTFERFASVAAGLGIVFAVAPWIGAKKKLAVAIAPKVRKKKTRR